MKKVKIKGKLSLDKMTVAKLNDDSLNDVQGGGILSIGKQCNNTRKSGCGGHPDHIEKITRGIWCKL